MDTYNNINLTPEFIKAFTAAQGDLTNPLKTGKSQGYHYVELDVILDLVRPVLSKHGLGITQMWYESDGKDMLETVLFHESGGSIHGKMPLRLGNLKHGSEMQQLGAAMTYARKYAILALLGLVGDKDDDATPSTRSAPDGALQALLNDPEYETYLDELANSSGRSKQELKKASLGNPTAALSALMGWKVKRADKATLSNGH
jgi:hypothetical protein